MDRYRGRAPYSGPLCGKITIQKRCEKIALWTAIGPWTAIGDGPLTGYFIYYRKRGSASYIVREVFLVREREREIQTDRDGSDVTIVVLKLAMSLHFPLPKIRTWQ